jgi:hypothetical protein
LIPEPESIKKTQWFFNCGDERVIMGKQFNLFLVVILARNAEGLCFKGMLLLLQGVLADSCPGGRLPLPERSGRFPKFLEEFPDFFA